MSEDALPPPLRLGFLEDVPEHPRLTRTFFPSKTGGKPAWLHPAAPPRKELQCGQCQGNLVFLLQVYAPLDTVETAFHRTVFVFACPKAECQASQQSVVAFRSQLERQNPFFSYEPPADDDEDPNPQEYPVVQGNGATKLCFVCGVPAGASCAKCGVVGYCDKEHQVDDWKRGHKAECDRIKAARAAESGDHHRVDVVTLDKRSAPSAFIVKEYELAIDEDDEPGDESGRKRSDSQASNSGSSTGSSSEGERDEGERGGAGVTATGAEAERVSAYLASTHLEGEMSKAEAKEVEKHVQRRRDELGRDEQEMKFQHTVARANQQVIRYSFDAALPPLWMSGRNQCESIPACPHCGTNRVFEFQIMPQLLYLLGEDGDGITENMDWGIIAVYSCPNSCQGPDPYTREFVWKQAA